MMRKDYVLIASAIDSAIRKDGTLADPGRPPAERAAAARAYETAVAALCGALHYQNPHFDHKRFKAAALDNLTASPITG